MSLLLQLLQDQCHNARPLHHYQLINKIRKHAEQGHQLHSKELFDLEFPSIASEVDSSSILEPDLSASGSTDNVDNNQTIGSSQSSLGLSPVQTLQKISMRKFVHSVSMREIKNGHSEALKFCTL